MRPLSELPRALAISAALATLVSNGCRDPLADPVPVRAAELSLTAHDPELAEATASIRWNAITRNFIADKPAATKPSPVAALRAFAYLTLAQYRAVVAAHEPLGGPLHASPQGAVAAASTVVLSALFPQDAAFFGSQLHLQESEAGESKGATSAFAAGESVGRAVGEEIAELARSDRFDAVWTGTGPTGPGYWSSDFDPPRPPQLPLLGQMRPFLMTSGISSGHLTRRLSAARNSWRRWRRFAASPTIGPSTSFAPQSSGR